MRKLIIILSITCLCGIAEARKWTVTGSVVLYTSLEALLYGFEIWEKDKDLGRLLVGEMIAKGDIIRPDRSEELDVIYTTETGIAQVLYRGKIFYAIKGVMECR